MGTGCPTSLTATNTSTNCRGAPGAAGRNHRPLRHTSGPGLRLRPCWLGGCGRPSALIIATLGGYSFTRLRLAHPPSWPQPRLCRVYGFDAPTLAAYRAHMQSWLRQVQPAACS